MTNIFTSLTLKDLRTIIHGLKMANFSFVEDGAIDEINSMIRALPSPEELGTLANTPDAIKKIQEQIGNIMRIIELYGKRDMEYKVRYKSKTGLPPRYKIMDLESLRRVEMKKESQLTILNNLTRNLIKFSYDLEKENLIEQADKIILCAKKIQFNEIPFIDLYNVTKDIIVFCDNGELRKEAQISAFFDISLDDIKQGLIQIDGWINYIKQTLGQKINSAAKNIRLKKFVNTLQEIWKQISQLQNITTKPLQQIDVMSKQVEQQMASAIPKNIRMKDKTGKMVMVPIEWQPDPEDNKLQIATVISPVDGKRYEVQTDERTRGLTLKLIEGQEQIGASPETASSGQNKVNTIQTIAQEPNLQNIQDTKIIENIIKMLERIKSAKSGVNVAKFDAYLCKFAMALAIPQEIIWYIHNIKNNPNLLNDFINKLKQRKRDLETQPPQQQPPQQTQQPSSTQSQTQTPNTDQSSQQMSVGFNLSKYLKKSYKNV